MAHVRRTLNSEAERAHHELRSKIAGFSPRPFEPPESCQVVLDGRRFHYLDWGARPDEVVLFLHGGGQTARTWDAICHAITSDGRRRAIALDQRGHGDSEWSYEFDYGPDAHARDVLALLNHLQIDRVSVVGMSMGCINGLRFALDHPDRVSSFTAVDAGPWINTNASQSIVEFVQVSSELESVDAYVRQALAFNPRRHPELLKRSLRHNLRELPNGRWTWKTDWRRPSDFVEAIKRAIAALRDEVEHLACPLLVVRGAESEIFLDAHAQKFAHEVPDGRWCRIEGAGHAVQGDQPHALAEALEEFWGRLLAQGRTLSNT